MPSFAAACCRRHDDAPSVWVVRPAFPDAFDGYPGLSREIGSRARGVDMSRYQLREDDGSVVAEESFDSFETAKAWAIETDPKPGWTLFQQIGGDWTPARFDPS